MEMEETETTTTQEDNNIEDLIRGIKNMKMEETVTKETTETTMVETDTTINTKMETMDIITADIDTVIDRKEEDDIIMADAIKDGQNSETNKAPKEQEEKDKRKR